MNLTSPIMTGAVKTAGLPDDSAGALLRVFSGTGWFTDSADGGLGIMMSALAGVAAALAVAILLSVYFHGGYRSRSDLVKHGLAASAALALLAFVISDMRNAALAYLGLNPARPAVEFEIRMPKAALTTAAAFGPWHLADGIIPVGDGAVSSETHNAFAIRYRVL